MFASMAIGALLSGLEGPALAVTFPRAGAVRCAQATDLIAASARGGIALTCVDRSGASAITLPLFAPDFGCGRCKLFFKLVSSSELPQPLILVAGYEPGGTSSLLDATIVGEVNGRLKALLPHRPTTEWSSICVGALGIGKGVGALVSHELWEPPESHPDPHRFLLRVYRFSKSGLTLSQTFRTRGRYDLFDDAAKELGFSCKDQLRSFFSPNN
jgi:hypothetical protein